MCGGMGGASSPLMVRCEGIASLPSILRLTRQFQRVCTLWFLLSARPSEQLRLRTTSSRTGAAALNVSLEPMTADANKWLELKEKIRRQIKDVRRSSRALEERRREHQRELATVRTATISHPFALLVHRPHPLNSSAVAFQAR